MLLASISAKNAIRNTAASQTLLDTFKVHILMAHIIVRTARKYFQEETTSMTIKRNVFPEKSLNVANVRLVFLLTNLTRHKKTNHGNDKDEFEKFYTIWNVLQIAQHHLTTPGKKTMGQRKAAAEACEKFTKTFPMLFNRNMTRKMHA